MSHSIRRGRSTKPVRLRFIAHTATVLCVTISALAWGHVDTLEAQPDTTGTSVSDTTRTAVPDRSQVGAPGGPQGPQAPYVMPPLGASLFDHLHNKIIHFPIVLTLVAAVMVLLSRRKPELEPVAFWLVWTATLFTLAAYFSGIAQAVEFERRPKRWLVDTHRNWGIALAVAQSLWILLLLRRRTRGIGYLWSVVVAGLVLVSAFLGGLIAHSRGARPPSEPARVEARP